MLFCRGVDIADSVRIVPSKFGYTESDSIFPGHDAFNYGSQVWSQRHYQCVSSEYLDEEWIHYLQDSTVQKVLEMSVPKVLEMSEFS